MSGSGPPADHFLYEGWITHRRHSPVRRSFRYRVAMPLLMLDDLDGALARHPLWSRRPAPVRFHRPDYLDGGHEPLADVVRRRAAEVLGAEPVGPVAMLANLRTAGWCFNPLTTYWLWDGDDLAAQVLEVTSTPWHERVLYVVDLRSDSDPQPWQRRFPKAMHVSPLMALDQHYRLRSSVPDGSLTLWLGNEQDGELVHEATMTMRRRPLDRRSMTRLMVNHPLLPLRVSAAIYTQAARAWLAGVPFVPHPGRAGSAPAPARTDREPRTDRHDLTRGRAA